MSENYDAPPGTIWVCAACGKTQRNKHGGTGPSRGWDVSCCMNAILCQEDTLQYHPDGRAKFGKEIEQPTDT